MFEKFLKILDLGDQPEVSIPKITTLKILSHLSNGLRFFDPGENTYPLLVDEGYFTVLSQRLSDAELLVRIKD